jgi:hypothetical protein
MKILSSLKTCIYPKWFPNASAVTWSLVLQTRNLANKIEEFQKCDDLSGEISQLTDTSYANVECWMYQYVRRIKQWTWMHMDNFIFYIMVLVMFWHIIWHGVGQRECSPFILAALFHFLISFNPFAPSRSPLSKICIIHSLIPRRCHWSYYFGKRLRFILVLNLWNLDHFFKYFSPGQAEKKKIMFLPLFRSCYGAYLHTRVLGGVGGLALIWPWIARFHSIPKIPLTEKSANNHKDNTVLVSMATKWEIIPRQLTICPELSQT